MVAYSKNGKELDNGKIWKYVLIEKNHLKIETNMTINKFESYQKLRNNRVFWFEYEFWFNFDKKMHIVYGYLEYFSLLSVIKPEAW